MDKRSYSPPRVKVYDLTYDLPKWLQELRDELVRDARNPHVVTPAYTTAVDKDRKFVEVSESSCKLVGYRAQEFIGMRYDVLTCPNTADIPLTNNLFTRLGCLHGLWMLVHGTGYRMLIRYESWLRADANIESNIELMHKIIRAISPPKEGAKNARTLFSMVEQRRAKRYGFAASVRAMFLETQTASCGSLSL